ncbi:MAG: glycosyltransferase family 39 protein [Verrucomicrobiota bacterium]
MKSLHAVGLMLVVWSFIYLSFLGERELRGEEARRIIPAQEMIEDDQWVVTTIAGEHYGNKPPLINWIIAGSFLLTGSESEWAARLPSVLSFLLLALAVFFTFRERLGVKRAVSISLVLLTAGSLIEKYRMAEIEGIFITLFGFACLSWIALWTAHRSPWLLWTVPYLFIGFGCLAKGPVHLLFWVLFLFSILRWARSMRDLFHPAHLLGLLIMAAIPLPWVLSNLGAAATPDDSVDNWIQEITKRADFSPEALKGWATHPLEMLINFLPWTIPLIFSLWCLRKNGKPNLPLSKWDAVIRGSFWSAAFSALALLTIPGGLPRYLLPLYVPASVALVGLYFQVDERRRHGYELFVYYSLLILSGIATLLLLGALFYSVREGLQPLWGWVILSLGCLAGFLIWLVRKKTSPGVFFSTPIAIAIAFLFLSSVAIPFEREEYQFRSGASEIQDLAAEVEGIRVFYADSKFRNIYPKHLRLIYYLGDQFVAQGESKTLPEDTEFLIGRTGSEPAMRELIGNRTIERSAALEIDGLPFTAFYLSGRPD